MPTVHALCEVCYDNWPIRKARFISDDGFNGAPFWTDEKGEYIVRPHMTGWRYVHEDIEKKAESMFWLNTLPLTENQQS